MEKFETISLSRDPRVIIAISEVNWPLISKAKCFHKQFLLQKHASLKCQSNETHLLFKQQMAVIDEYFGIYSIGNLSFQILE